MKSVSNGLGTDKLGKGGIDISGNLSSFSSSDLLDDSMFIYRRKLLQADSPCLVYFLS